MAKPFNMNRAFYWALPLTLLAGSAYVVGKNRTHRPKNPIVFEPSGETAQDSEQLEQVRAEWHQRNNGMGLRDVRYPVTNNENVQKGKCGGREGNIPATLDNDWDDFSMKVSWALA
ncbi:hypothetical protein [Absidia glauca]|uniref:SCP domain-containing protein n=1 Tax=Absidia glauca TaxID=4829 RepID=A0A163K0K7_ABSGL|nr:hypothetical protein [Absidia glauca]